VRCIKSYIWHFTSYEGFCGIINSKELWLQDTLKMNDDQDRTYGKECVTEAIQSCGANSILCKYKGIDIEPERPLLHHYSMSFCKFQNTNLWENYADDEKGMALVFDIDKLHDAINDTCESSSHDVLNFRDINYELSISKIEELCITLEKRHLNNGPGMHDKSGFPLIKNFLYSFYSGYTKEKKWEKEKEYRLCYVDVSSDLYTNASSEILEILKKDRIEMALKKLGLHELINGHYSLKLGSTFTSSVLPYIYIGSKSPQNRSTIQKILQKQGFNSTSILDEGQPLPK